MSELSESIRVRYLAVQENIKKAAERVGRDFKSVKLVTVTKAQSIEVTRATIEAGAMILGENYPEEGVLKIHALQDFSAVEWHMIGHVQSRKAKDVALNFNYLHSLDSLKLAKRLNRFCEEAGSVLSVLLEFNVGDEASKGGWLASRETNWKELLSDISEILALSRLKVRGLMAMPPLGTTPEFSRPYFQKLKDLQAFLIAEFPQADFSELSMGTSSDYEVAIEEGATFVRVGTAIVGGRHYDTEKE